MAQFELKMPKLGESITEATITKWLKQEGDSIELDDPILEIATDKVDSEIPSPVEGVLKKQLFQEGDVVEVDAVIALIDLDGEEGGEDAVEKAGKEEVKKDDKQAVKEEHDGKAGKDSPQAASGDEPKDGEAPAGRSSGERFYSPLVRNIARQEGLSREELDGIRGSGQNDRVTKEDLLAYLKNRTEGKKAPKKQEDDARSAPQTAARTEQAAVKAPPIPVSDEDEVIEMDRMRKLIAEHMVMSEATSVHITLFAEADLTRLVHWRNKNKKILEEREGEKLTFTPIFIQAIARALRDFPMVNVSVDGDRIIKRKHINIGMAAALPNGNLIVPVIRDADHKSLLGLAKEVNDLARRARENKLKPDEIQGGTFTLTNFGTFGITTGTPIINQPQVGILGVGLIGKKPVVIDTPEGETIGIRHRMELALGCDHRVVDGALGGMFLRRVADYLEQFDTKQNI
jgi:2-oxoglutarate dehydrogenase E2 component (dihydrolipoamide succinyltransferase)